MPQENPEFTDPFYIKKFMEIQRGNVVLWRKLKNLESDNAIKDKIEQTFGLDFFKNIDDLVK
jgi:hypothetical protein